METCFSPVIFLKFGLKNQFIGRAYSLAVHQDEPNLMTKKIKNVINLWHTRRHHERCQRFHYSKIRF
jgi:hypothetical protein